jgi:5-(carboxyamino)imidazole ribonucleotide mutase
MIAILMGSDSDLEQVRPCLQILKSFGIPAKAKVCSAHRTPEALHNYIKETEANTEVYIAAAGGAAHLGGVIASLTTKPVVGIPILGSSLGGADSLYSFVQMPGGIPVATMGIGKAGAKNAGLFAAQIIALKDADVAKKLTEYRVNMAEEVGGKDVKLQEKLASEGL